MNVQLTQASPFSNPSGGTVAMTLGQSDVTVLPEPGVVTVLLVGSLGLATLSRRPRRPMIGSDAASVRSDTA